MPEPSDDQLKEKVQKLERLLRTREERIVALETENAMLYLKLAQCQGSVRSYRTESNHFRRLFEVEEGFKKKASEGLKKTSKQVQDLKSDVRKLKEAIKALPNQISVEMERAKTLSSQFGTKKLSNMEELQSKLMETEMALDVALRKAATEKDRRRTLHNTLVEIQGNIRVYCRVRPLIAKLDAQGDKDALGKQGTPSEQVVFVDGDENIFVNTPKQSGGQRQFEFEKVYNPETTTQENVFNDVAPLLTSLLDGYNVCIMAYGQTGSGKTHTMMGSHDVDVDIDSESLLKDEGIIPRAAKEVFRLIAERENPNETRSLEVAVCEIYNNEVRDLLAGKNQSSRLDIVTSSEGATEIPSLVTRNVKTVQDVMAVVYYGMQRRREDATMVHAHSSRSHLIVQLNLYTITTRAAPTADAAPSPPGTPTRSRRTLPQPTSAHASRSTSPAPRGRTLKRSKSPAPGRSRSPSPSRSNGNSSSGSNQPTQISVKTKLQLVDLAGSESVGMSGVTGAALRETSFINKSLSALADVLGALSEQRSHVPYRNTRLTHMLQDTIGGDAKLLVMLCVSQVQRYITETLQCLGFGSRARQVARGQAKKRRPTSFVPSSLSLDLSPITSSLRGNGGALSPRIKDLRGSGRRKSNFNFPD